MKTTIDVLRSALAFAQRCVDGRYRDTDGDYVKTYYFETVKRDELIPELQCAIAIKEAKIADAERFSVLCDCHDDVVHDALCEKIGNRKELTRLVDELIQEAKAAS